MKTSLSFGRVALAALALGTATITASFAQTTTTPAATTPAITTAPTGTTGDWHHHGHHHHLSFLSASEKAQLKKAKEAAIAGSGTLQSQKAALKQQFATLKSQSNTTPDQWKALHQQAADFHTQLRSAELLIDPTLAPVFAKIDAHKHGHHSNT